MSGSRHREPPVGDPLSVGPWPLAARAARRGLTGGPVEVRLRGGIAMIEERRLVGIDLGIASDHTVRVLDGHGGEVCRRRAYPTVDSLAAVEAAALSAAVAGTRLEVVIEPTGPAWLPIAV